MVRIRLSRKGRRNRAFFRIEVFDQRTRRDGAAIEQLGWYNPYATEKEKPFELNAERAKYWIDKGAQPTPTIWDLLHKVGVNKPVRVKPATKRAKA